MFKKLVLTGALAVSVFTAACGGGGGGSDSGSSGGTNGSSSGGPTGNSVAVAGPLDTVQTTVSSQVLSQLEGATQGTPLAGLLTCTDYVVNQNTLDVLDALLVGLQNPSTLSTTTPAQVQALLMEIANNLGGTLNSLAGKSGCGAASGGSANSGSIPTSNPLAGTPLAPLGDALLPILQQIQSQTGGGTASGNGLAQLALLVDQLNNALQTGMAQIPASTFSQPVVGGVLTTLKTSVANLAALTDAFAANNTTQFQAATQNLLNNLLVNVLTQIVPTSFIETQAGKQGTLTGPIDQAAATFSAAVATALTQGMVAIQAALSNSQLAPVVNPVLNQLLPAILGPINQALAGVGGSSSSSGGSSSSSGGGLTGTPLDALLGPLSSILGGILGGTGSGTIPCVFAGTPLAFLCKLLP